MADTTFLPAFFQNNAAAVFANSSDLNSFFMKKKGTDFITWFNANLAQKNYWGAAGGGQSVKMATDADAPNRFNQLWDQIPVLFGTPSINLLQFISLMSIVNNETGGSIKPVTERVGNAANPALAYAFNKIPGIKRSYNTLDTNITAYDLFHNADYITQFGKLPMGAQLANTTNVAFKGETWPAGINTATDPAVNGFVIEADFFKFRGRGFIQTTNRGNYKALVNFVLGYKGTNPLVLQYQKKWAGSTADKIATISTNADWDALFQTSQMAIPAAAISVHNKLSGSYLGKLTMAAGAEANVKKMGFAIAGGGAATYASLFLNRVVQIANAI
ncbi:MAG: hypothetical protein JWO44_350 [Bacteroidetes bacterium]|nr:hypothetical protein [Bacteroidota bacterium]